MRVRYSDHQLVSEIMRPSARSSLRRRWSAHFFRLLRYSAVGIGVSLLYSGLVVVALGPLNFRSPSAASLVAFLLVLPVSFYAHQVISFHDAGRDGRQPYRFAVIAVTSFVLAVGGMHLVTEVWKLHYLFGIALAWILIPTTNFLINSLWVFPLSGTIDAKNAEGLSTSRQKVPPP
jgi:putative flippase GtrA